MEIDFSFIFATEEGLKSFSAQVGSTQSNYFNMPQFPCKMTIERFYFGRILPCSLCVTLERNATLEIRDSVRWSCVRILIDGSLPGNLE